MPTLLAEQDTDIAGSSSSQLSGFKPDFISNTWAAADWLEVRKEQHRSLTRIFLQEFTQSLHDFTFYLQFMEIAGGVGRVGKWGRDTGNGIPEAQDTCVILAVTQCDTFLAVALYHGLTLCLYMGLTHSFQYGYLTLSTIITTIRPNTKTYTQINPLKL